ncbi:MAG: hypothetical protein KC586_05290 [Myxococcales bacterium]|nr:hypothetical protein [Myxococcales bacterium]
MRTLLFLSLSLSLVACGDDDGGRADGGGRDSGMVTPMDGGGIDTGTMPGVDSGIDSGGGSSDCNVGGSCNLLANDCTTAGEGCYLTSDGPVCAAAGTASEGEPCPSLNDCREGLGCFRTADGPATCRRLCCRSSGGAECPLGDLCLGFTDAPGNLGFCRTPSSCNPIEQTGCDAGEACVVIAGDGSVDCLTGVTGSLTQGGDCMPDDARCAAGFICLGPMAGPNFCARFCDPAVTPDSCGEGLVCNRIDGFPANLGACAPM